MVRMADSVGGRGPRQKGERGARKREDVREQKAPHLLAYSVPKFLGY